MSMRTFKRLLLASFFAMALAGCDQSQVYKVQVSQLVYSFREGASYVFVVNTDQIIDPVTGAVKQAFETNLSPILVYAKSNPQLKISIHAYGNDVLSDDYGGELYGFQADTIAAYFWSKGIDESRLAFKGFKPGERSVNNNHFPNSAADNRRIEIRFH